MKEKFEFIEGEECGKFSVRQMCAWAKVSRSWYQGWKQHQPTATDRWQTVLARMVTDVFTALTALIENPQSCSPKFPRSRG